MTLNDIIKVICEEINEDYYSPMFWKYTELQRYAIEGINRIIYDCELLATDSLIPLFAIVDANIPGLYLAPFNDIQSVLSLTWRGQDSDSNIEFVSIKQMDLIDYNWRRSTETGIPKYAVVYNGDANINGLNVDILRNTTKFKLYPIPSTYNTDVTTATLEYKVGTPTPDKFGGLAGNSDSITPTVIDPIVSGIDINDDGINDIVIDSSSEQYFGILISLVSDILVGNYYNIPIITYTPDISEKLKQLSSSLDINKNLGINNNLISAIVEYCCYKCFAKESESVDLNKAQMRYANYKNLVSEFNNQNLAYRTLKLQANTNFL